jgi:hypothetical protein
VLTRFGYGSVSISREPDLDGGKLTLRMSLFAVTARFIDRCTSRGI